MASQFLYVVGAGLAILVVGGVLAGFVSEAPGSTTERGDAIFADAIGTIGTINATSRSINFGDMTVEAGEPNATVATRNEIRVDSNVLGASADVIEFEATRPERVYISFVPAESADPDSLVITVNGERVDVPDYTAGERVTVSSDAVQQGSNVVRVTAEKPGLAVWRMPRYTLSNVEVVLTDRANEQVVEPFRAYDYEVSGFDRGELSFSVTEDVVGSQPMEVTINDNVITSRTPIKRALPYEVTFAAETTDLRAGENVLGMRTSGDASYPLNNVQLTLYFYGSDRQRTVSRTVNITESDYSRIGGNNGRITVDVASVNLPRPVTITFGDAEFSRTLNGGRNTFEFGQDAVEVGNNELTLSTGGSYRIANLTVSAAE